MNHPPGFYARAPRGVISRAPRRVPLLVALALGCSEEQDQTWLDCSSPDTLCSPLRPRENPAPPAATPLEPALGPTLEPALPELPPAAASGAETGVSPMPLTSPVPPPPCGTSGLNCCASPAPACAPQLRCQGGPARCEPCASFRLLDLYPGHTSSAARAVSPDGRWVVGRSSGEGIEDHAVLWDLTTGAVRALGTLPGGTRSLAHAISGDGLSIVGQADASDESTGIALWSGGASEPEWLGYGEGYATNLNGSVVTGRGQVAPGRSGAFRWTRATGVTPLTALDGTLAFEGLAVNADGSVIVGDGASREGFRAMRWTDATGAVSIGVLPGGDDSVASTITADGATVFGISNDGRGAWVFRWTPSSGMQAIVPLIDTYESLPATNTSGSVVVGRSYRRAFVWNASSNRWSTLTDALGRLVPGDFELASATGVADDGRTIVGTGQSNSLGRGWVAVLGADCSSPDPRSVAPAPLAPPANAAPGGPEPRCAAFRALGVSAGQQTSAANAVSGDGRVAVGLGRAEPDAPSVALRWSLDDGSVRVLSDEPYTEAVDVSADGSVVVGFSQATDVRQDAFRWTEAEGFSVFEVNAAAVAVSADGATIVGVHPSDPFAEAFRWTAQGVLGLNAPFDLIDSRAFGVSADGALVLGQGARNRGTELALAWTPNGLIELGAFTATSASYASDASDDGAVIVGVSGGGSAALPGIFRWTQGEGLVRLALGALDDSPPKTNATGSVVVGRSRNRAFLWDSATGFAGPVSVLLGELVPPGWVLLEATGVSRDGRVIVGRGRSPEHVAEAWMAVLGPSCSAGAR